jgi:hypothetical protein
MYDTIADVGIKMANHEIGEVATQTLKILVNDGSPEFRLSPQVCAAYERCEPVLTKTAILQIKAETEAL